MFNKLIASEGKKSFWTPRTVVLSIVVHGVLLAGAVYATVLAPPEAKKKEELVTYVEIKEKPPEPPAPEEQAPKPPPPPKGFKTLTPPTEPPSVIPDVNLNAVAVDPSDFSGIGEEGGSAEGVTEAPVDSSNFVYQVQVLSKAPALSNRSQVSSILSRYYPRMLQDAGIGGTTQLQFVIEKDGTVDESTVKVLSTTQEQFGDASIKAVSRFRFSPGLYNGEPVRVLSTMPITWQPAG